MKKVIQFLSSIFRSLSIPSRDDIDQLALQLEQQTVVVDSFVEKAQHDIGHREHSSTKESSFTHLP